MKHDVSEFYNLLLKKKKAKKDKESICYNVILEPPAEQWPVSSGEKPKVGFAAR